MAMKQELTKAVTTIGMGALGAVGSAIFLRAIMPGQDWANKRPWFQLGGGLALAILAPGKFQIVKLAGMGAALAGITNVAERMRPGSFLANNRRLLPSQLNQLRLGMQNGMGRAVDVMRRPVNVMSGGNGGGWGQGRWN